MADQEKKSVPGVAKVYKYFGKKPGQNTAGLKAEIDELRESLSETEWDEFVEAVEAVLEEEPQ